MYTQETGQERARRIEADLLELRIMAYLVTRNRYNREPRKVEGGRRGRPEIVTTTWYTEPADRLEAERAVRAAMERQDRRAG